MVGGAAFSFQVRGGAGCFVSGHIHPFSFAHGIAFLQRHCMAATKLLSVTIARIETITLRIGIALFCPFVGQCRIHRLVHLFLPARHHSSPHFSVKIINVHFFHNQITPYSHCLVPCIIHDIIWYSPLKRYWYTITVFFWDRISEGDAGCEVDSALVGVIFGMYAVVRPHIGLGCGGTEFGSGGGLDHEHNITLIRTPLFLHQSFHPGSHLFILATRLQNSLHPTNLGHAKSFRIWSQQINDRFPRITTSRPAPVSIGHHPSHKQSTFVRPQSRNGYESIPLRPLWTQTGICSNLITTPRPRIGVAHGNQFRTPRAHTRIHLQLAFIHVINDHRAFRGNERGIRPRRGDRVIHVKFSHFHQASLRQGAAVGDLETAQVFLGIVVDDVDAVLLVAVSLGEVGDSGARVEAVDGIGAEVEEGRGFVDASVVGVADVAGGAGAVGGVRW
mmetsp:Transcript_1716/g.3427  ORF Transcript_1716/g.3427 Transcript_1716/m.3427 type:complete len:446 (+) Transcript_1716:118-1455(+)